MRAVLPTAPTGARPRVGEAPDPVAGRGEVVVGVRATALNRADLLQLRGLYPSPPGEPEGPGLECAGEIEALGEDVSGWSEGDRVMALLGGGGHAERVRVPAGQLMPVPDGLGWAEAAALPEAGLTAWTNLVAEGGLEAGETLLVTGATGGMGSFAVQLGRELGATVAAAGRDPARLGPLRDAGATHLLADDESLPERLRSLTGGAHLVFDTVAGDRLGDHLAALRERGRLVLVGLMAGPTAELDLALVLRRRLRILGSVLRPRPRPEKARLVADFWRFAAGRLADGRLSPVVREVFPWSRIEEAYEALASGRGVGKVVVEL